MARTVERVMAMAIKVVTRFIIFPWTLTKTG